MTRRVVRVRKGQGSVALSKEGSRKRFLQRHYDLPSRRRTPPATRRDDRDVEGSEGTQVAVFDVTGMSMQMPKALAEGRPVTLPGVVDVEALVEPASGEQAYPMPRAQSGG